MLLPSLQKSHAHPQKSQTFGDKACHPERSEGSGSPDREILRCAQDDRQDLSQVRSREALSPNVCKNLKLLLYYSVSSASADLSISLLKEGLILSSFNDMIASGESHRIITRCT